jgi:quinoprotein glucose dehydrogenase
LKSPELKKLVESALKDADPTLRSEARRIMASVDPVRGVKSLAETITGDSISEQQAAIAALGALKRDDADAVLGSWFDKLLKGQLPPALHLDLIDAARSRGTPKLLEKITAYNKTRAAKDHLKDYREALVGGNAERGREIFEGRVDVSCRRCHKIDKSGGDVGPDLSRIGLDKSREYLLESIVDPNKQIAKGFETAILAMSDGKTYAGIVKQDDAEQLLLQLPDGRLLTVKKSEIDERTVGKSGMPEDLIKKLTKFEIRDLVEYLSTLKSKIDPAAHGKN